MSTQSAINLLKTYNKNNPYAKSQSTVPQSDKKFGTWSYANKYDALYDQYSGNKNFNINMWREAIKLGEQDQYFAFLEQNKDKTLSAQFYDPQFYDYESMMMEMFLPFADNTNREKYTQEVFNNETQKWEVRDLGELTQREYYDYLIKNTRELQQQKITRDLEQWRKDQLGFWGQLGADIGATAAEFGEGILSALAGLSDFVIATGSGGLIPWAMDRESNYLDAFVNYFGQHGLTAAEKNTVRAALDEFERTHSHFRDIDGNMTGVGKYVAGISNSIGMMIPAIVANFATGGASNLAWLGTATFYSSIFSTNLYENANDPNRITSPSWVKLTNAAVKSGVEAVIEYGLGKLLGGTIQNNLLGLSGKLKAGAINLTKFSGWKYLLKSAGQESLEEFLQDFSTNLADQFYGLWYEGYCNTGVTFQTLVDSLCIGFLSSLVMSGSRVGIDSGRSAIQNAIAKKKGTYNKDLKVGPGDMVIEKDGKVEKVTGLNRLYFGSILSDFRGAIDALKKGSINIKKDLRNAQEIYSAISTISQFYSSFDAERIKMCELLLDRVVKAEEQKAETQKVDERAKSILAPETVNAIEKSTKRTDVKAAVKSFATVVELTLNEMLNTNAIASRLKNIRTVADAVGADLEAGGVTKINTVTDADGIVHKNNKSTRIKDLEDELGKKGMETYEELRKKYEYVVTTDGHVICERDGFVFVSEAWLKNYSGSDLDRFLEQTHVIKSLAEDKALRSMFDELYKFVKEFTGQEMSYEDTIMQFLFNESVYQAFLLSQKTDAVHKYKEFIFSLYNRFELIAKDSKYYQQVFGKDRKPAKPRQEMLEDILRKIQNTMRRPTIKAILNWGFNPQTIGAERVLTPEDKRFILAPETRKAVLAGGGKGPGGKSAHRNLIKDIMMQRLNILSEDEAAFIERVSSGNATEDEKLEMRMMLDEFDYVGGIPFELNIDNILLGRLNDLNAEIRQVVDDPTMSNETRFGRYKGFSVRFADLINMLMNDYDDREDEIYSPEVVQEYQAILTEQEHIDEMMDAVDARAERKGFLLRRTPTKGEVAQLMTFVANMQKFTNTLVDRITTQIVADRRERGVGAFTVPFTVAAQLMNEPAKAQFVTDKFDEFRDRYGVTVEGLWHQRYVSASAQQLDTLLTDMYMLTGMDDITDRNVLRGFIQRKMEQMLGDEYLFVPRTDDSFEVVTKIPAEKFLPAEILGLTVQEQNDIFAKTFWRIKDAKSEVAEQIDPTPLIAYLDETIQKFERKADHLHADELKILQARLEVGETPESVLGEIVYMLSDGVDPFTGEVFVEGGQPVTDESGEVISEATTEKRIVNQVLYDLWGGNDALAEAFFTFAQTRKRPDRSVHLSDLIDVSQFPKRIQNIVVKIDSVPGEGGHYSPSRNEIVISEGNTDSYFDTLVHEVDHAIQETYSLPSGFHWDTAYNMHDLLSYITKRYPNYVSFVARRAANSFDNYLEKLRNGKEMSVFDIKSMSNVTRMILAKAAYMMIQGEIFSRTYMHNEKTPHGFSTVSNYIVSPDGRERFKIIYDTDNASTAVRNAVSSNRAPEMTPAVAEAVLSRDAVMVLNMMRLKDSSMYVRDTFHAMSPNAKPAFELNKLILRDGLPIHKQYVTLDTIIRNPQEYLSDGVLEACHGDFRVGNVLHRVKEFIEDNTKGISIDVLHDGTFVYVSDYEFNDFLAADLKARAKSDKETLVEKYETLQQEIADGTANRDDLMLEDFYGPRILSFVESCTVALRRDAGGSHTTENGITIQIYDGMTDAQFVKELNHELRHYIQYKQGFVVGTDVNFDLPDEAIAEMKKHLPGYFKNTELREVAERSLAKNPARARSVDELLAKLYVYYFTSGEMMAYAIDSGFLHTQPIIMDRISDDRGTFAFEWYDKNTGEGRWTVTFYDEAKRVAQVAAKKSTESKTSIEGKKPVKKSTNEKKPAEGKKSTKKKKTKNDDDEAPLVEKRIRRPRPAEGAEPLPYPEIKGKAETKEVTYEDTGEGKKGKKIRKYTYKNNRHFTKASAEGTNLMNFYRPGEQNQMAPELQAFIKDTTGHLDQLPPELAKAIAPGGKRKGYLTEQALFKWFRNVKAENVNQFTFDLIKKHFFNDNPYITDMESLDELTNITNLSFYWAIIPVLRAKGLDHDVKFNENTVDKLKAFFNTQMSRAEQRQVEELQTAYEKIWVTDKSGALSYENAVFDERLSQYARVMIMKWFDGTITGAYYAANNARTILRAHEEELRNKIESTNKKISEDKDGNTQDIEDTMGTRDRENDDEAGAEEDQILRTVRSTGNDLIAIYEEELANSLFANVSDDEMIFALAEARGRRLRKKNSKDGMLTEELKEWIAKKVDEYQDSLWDLEQKVLHARYRKLMNAKLTDTEIKIDDKRDEDAAKNRRVNIVKRIKNKAKTLLKMFSEGKVAFAQLPDEVQALFERTSAKTEKGKTIEGYVLKESAYSVGRGRARIEKETDRGRIDYAEKHNIVEGNDVFKHDVTEILKNDALLRDTLKQVRSFIAHKDNTIKKATKTTRKNALAMSERIAKWSTDTTKGEGKYNAEFKVRKNKNSVSDTPTVFNISSNVDMPKPLYNILSTSFTKFADTMVQFVSVDEKTGKVYDKEDFPKKKDFDSLVQHEVMNWDLFYEVNQDTLLNFTRDDVLDIIKFFAKGSGTIDGPMNKYGAFTVFLLGFFVDGARRNFNSWDFSADEIKTIERLYEEVASYFGSGLRAVQQMLKVVDPMKKVRSRMFNDWEAITDEDTDALIEATDKLNMMKDKGAREEQAKVITTMLNDFAEKQKAYERTNLPRWSKAWWRRQWSKLKSWRYMSMLSGPATWVRNSLSNVIVTGLNATADQVSRLIFIPKKGYREDQWDLPGTKISDDVKAFIDTYIGKRGKKNPLFDDLYDVQTKYDSAAKAKIKHEKNLLAELIAEAWVKKYAADNRFDSKGFKLISKFVDARISDGRFVKFASRRYFGKILTIEVERGNVSLSNGFDSKVMTLFAESILLANQEYMHKRSAVANMLDNIRERYPQLHEALTFWQPFINSSFNWWQETLKYTPVGLALAINKMVKLEKQITELDARRAKGERVPDSRFVEFLVRRDIGKGTLGLLLSMMGVWLAISGMVRIEEDDDKFYLYCADNIKLDITQIFGSSSLLLGSAVAQHWIKQSDGEVASLEEVLTMITNVTMNGFFAADLLERYKWGSLYDNALREGESMFKSFVPQLWQTIVACMNEQGIRYSSGFMGSFERVFNSFAPTQPMGTRKVNPYTGEIEDKYAAVLLPVVGPLLQKGIIGPKIYWVDVSKQEKLAKEYQVNRAELTGQLTVNGKKYELDRLALNQKYGELNKKSLAQVTSQRHKVRMEDGSYKTLHWNQLNAEQRENVITNIMNKNADYAKIYTWTQKLKHKYYASESVWTTLRQLGLTRNVYKGDKGFVE